MAENFSSNAVVRGRRWYVWVLWVVWLALFYFFLDAGFGSLSEHEPRAATFAFVLALAVLAAGWLFWFLGGRRNGKRGDERASTGKTEKQ